MIDLEDRLRSDLGRLADVIAAETLGNVAALEAGLRPPRSRHRVLAISAAAFLALVIVTGVLGVILHGRGPRSSPASSPRIVAPSKWRAVPPSPLGPRAGAVVAWTGREVLVWGGFRGNSTVPLALQNGAAYDPATKSWRRIADNRWAHPGATGVWAGDRLYVLAKNGGAVYVSATNTWRDLPRLPSSRGGGFIAAAWSGHTLFGLVEQASTQIAFARYDPHGDVWTVGRSWTVSSDSHLADTSVAWTGSRFAVATGSRFVWSYAPATDAWRSIVTLPPDAASTSVTSMHGTVTVVYKERGALRAAELVGRRVRPLAAAAHTSIGNPVAVDAGGELVAFDQSGRGVPERADPSTGAWVTLGRVPVKRGVDGVGVWAGSGLFLWGGLPSGTPATFKDPTPGTPDAAFYGP